VLETRPARDWVKKLNDIGVPAGVVLTVPEILNMPQIADRGFLHWHENVPGVGRDIPLATTGIKLDGTAPTVRTPPPILGEHNEEIWRELGLSKDDINKLKKDGVV
jgi:formyl-CoA transferase